MYEEPKGDTGSFEPRKASYDEGEDTWEVLCVYTKEGKPRAARVEIDDGSEEVVSFDIEA